MFVLAVSSLYWSSIFLPLWGMTNSELLHLLLQVLFKYHVLLLVCLFLDKDDSLIHHWVADKELVNSVNVCAFALISH